LLLIAPSINIDEKTYSNSTGNKSKQQTEELVKKCLFDKTVTNQEQERLSIILFYFVNARAVSLTQSEFLKLTGLAKGSFTLQLMGLYTLDRLIRVRPQLIDQDNLNDFFETLIQSTTNEYLRPISFRIIAVFLEHYYTINHTLDYKRLLKCIMSVQGELTERQVYYRSQSIGFILSQRPVLQKNKVAEFILKNCPPEHAIQILQHTAYD